MDSTPKPKAPGLAIVSLICGIFGFLTCLLTGIPAIITGHIAQSKIKASGGALGGLGMALTGTILGYLTTAGTLLIIPLAAIVTPAVFKGLERADEVTNINRGKLIQMALVDYALDHDDEFPPDLDTLVNSGSISDLTILEYKQRKRTHAWAYFPGLTMTDSQSIILAGPEHSSGDTRILVFADGSAKPETELDAQALAKTQGITLP